MHKNILIVGSNSILSKQLIIDLVSEYSVDVAYSGETCGINNTSPNFKAIALNDLFANNTTYDHIIIISAFIPNSSNANNKKLFEVNVELIEKITLKFPASKFIYCSTVSVYTPASEKITEKTPVNPLNEYGISKLWAEKIIQRNAKSWVIFRISSLIGTEMKNNTFVPLIIDNALNHKKITLFGNGSRFQNYIDVQNLSKMIKKSLKYEKNEVFLAVGEHSYTNTQLAEIVQKITSCKITYSGSDNSVSALYDNSFTKQELNFNYEKSIEKCIEEIVEWKLKQF